MKLILILLFIVSAAHAQRAVQKNPQTGRLLEGFKSGENTVEISAGGTLKLTGGFLLDGAAALKAALALDAVENTAVSTWGGTTNVTTLGTVTTGTWQASNIAPQYLGTGSDLAAKFLRGDGTWQALDLSAFQTTAGTLALAGFGAVTGTLAVANGGTGITSFGSGVAAALGNNVNSSGGLLTYSMLGTSGTKLPLLDAANTWGAAQSFPVGSAGAPSIKWDDADSGIFGSGANIYFTINGVTRWSVDYNGTLQGGSSSLQTTGNILTSYIYNRGGWYSMGVSDDTISQRRAADAWIHARGTNAQWLGVAKTYNSATNWEAIVLDWQTTANVARIGSDVGSGGGTARDVQLIRGGVVKSTLGANTTDHEQPVKLKSYTVSGLPSAATCGAGAMAAVSDADTPVVGSAVAGGGSDKVLVCSDGTDWVIIAIL